MHRTPLKCIVNPILRKIQFWTDEPWVISSICKKDEKGTWHFIKYELARVKCLGPYTGE